MVSSPLCHPARHRGLSLPVRLANAEIIARLRATLARLDRECARLTDRVATTDST